jgi:hypothetical protein
MPEESAQQTPAAAAPGKSPPQAPMGVSSVTGPTPNKGYEAAAIQRLGGVVNQLAEILPLAGPTSELGNAIMDAIKKFSKHVPAGANTPASERNDLQRRMMQNQQQQAQMQQMMRPQGQGGGAQPAGGPPQLPSMRAA